MKVKPQRIEEGVDKLMQKAIDAMPSSSHKFIASVAKGVYETHRPLSKMLEHIKDNDGLVDTEPLKKLLYDAMHTTDDKLTLYLFEDSGALSYFLKPMKLTLSIQDIESMFENIEHN